MISTMQDLSAPYGRQRCRAVRKLSVVTAIASLHNADVRSSVCSARDGLVVADDTRTHGAA